MRHTLSSALPFRHLQHRSHVLVTYVTASLVEKVRELEQSVSRRAVPVCTSRNFVPAVKMHASVSAVVSLATVLQNAGSPLLSESRCSALRIQVAPGRPG